MYLRDSYHTATQSSRPSVPGMRKLLPLTLLSPSSPAAERWPLSAPVRQPPTRVESLPHYFSQLSPRGESARNYQYWHHRANVRQSNQHRDITVYDDPGFPLPVESLAKDGLDWRSSRPTSLQNESTSFGNYEYLSDDPVDENPEPDEPDEISRTSYVQASRRDSDLSFQCYGEPDVPSEAEWLKSSPSRYQRSLPSTPVTQLEESRAMDAAVESWLSETSSDHEDEVLAFATALKPIKASLVEFGSPSSSRTRIASTTSCYSHSSPPLPDTPTSRNNLLNETPPISPDTKTAKEPEQPVYKRKFDGHLPQRRLDLAMSSPPVSPDDFPEPPAFTFPSPTHTSQDLECGSAEGSNGRTSDSRLDWPLPSPKPEDDIISKIEDSISTFPYTMLDLHSPAIEDIRLYFLAKHKRPISLHAAPDSSFPELEPFCRIFPESSPAHRSALYAHVLSNLCIDSLLQSDQSSVSETRCATPYWPDPSPIITNFIDSSVFESEPMPERHGYNSKRRLRGLQKDVQRCIQSLVRKMEDPKDDVDERSCSKVKITTLRMLEEIVKSSEARVCGCT